MSSSYEASSSDDSYESSNYVTSYKHGQRFTKEEDNLLRELAKDKRNMSWKEIASHLPGRTACQCRDRFNQYLFKKVVNDPWTPEEDKIIVEKYQMYGPHWVKISEFLPGRSGNNVKNRWHCALTKYHGISYTNTKQQRRPRNLKWKSETVSTNEIKPASLQSVKLDTSSNDTKTSKKANTEFRSPKTQDEIQDLSFIENNQTLLDTLFGKVDGLDEFSDLKF